jgi:hypothetical protein
MGQEPQVKGTTAARSGERQGTTRYARRIERLWSRLLGAPVVLSPRDWSVIERWHASGVPLAVVEHVLSESARSGGGRPRAGGLALQAGAVDEAWTVVREGRLIPRDGPPAPPADEPLRLWRERLQAEPPDSALAALLEELIERSRAGEVAELLDAELDRRLFEAVGRELASRVLAVVQEELGPYRTRWAPELLESTRRAACAARLRRLLALPRLVLSGPSS